MIIYPVKSRLAGTLLNPAKPEFCQRQNYLTGLFHRVNYTINFPCQQILTCG